MKKLAIHGGPRTIPPGIIKEWPPIDAIDRKMVMASLEQANHAFGPNCVEIEKEFAAWNGNKYAITTNSGTAALHMAIAACGVGAGDHVLVTAYSWSASATCIIHHNAIPIFVDIDFDTINIDDDKIEKAITPRTKAIVVVHLHGLAVNMAKVMAIARKRKLKVIEDACQAHGALFNGRKVGTFGDCAAFSLNQNKCLCSGEGGMFVTDDEGINAAARQIWNFGESRNPMQKRDFHAYALGWMYRNNDLTAAFGRAQLSKLDKYLEIVHRNGEILHKSLAGIPCLIRPTTPKGHWHNWYNFTSRIDFDKLGYNGNRSDFRDAVVKAMNAEGVPVGVWQKFILPAMTVFQAKNAYGHGCPWTCHHGSGKGVNYDPKRFPVATRHCDTHFGMTVPLRAPNGSEIARHVAKAFEKVFTNLEILDAKQILAQK